MAESIHHRKIELQSPDDLTYLVDNIRRAAAAEIEKALPQIHTANETERKEDDMRVVVEKLVNNYIQTTLQTLLPNITINGLAPDPSLIIPRDISNPTPVIEKREHEPINTKIFSRATELQSQELDLVEAISKSRREKPALIVAAQKAMFEKADGEDEEWMRAVEERESEIGGEGVLLEEGRLDGERLQSVKEGYLRGVRGLERVVEKGPGLVARVEKAAEAEEYVVHGR